jgi:hypothetical protein
MPKLIDIAVFAGLIAVVPLGAQTMPAALVASFEGPVQIRVSGGDPEPAVVGQRLEVGDEILPGNGGRVVLVTRTGAAQIVTQSTVIQDAPAASGSSMMARTIGVLAQAATSDARSGGGAAARQGMIRPIPGQTTLVSPRNGLTVQSVRPTFAWTPTPGQTYELMLRNTAGGRPEVFDAGTDTTWTYPDDLPALDFGATYAWTVFVGGRQGGRALPQQEFRVIAAPEFAQLNEFMNEIEEFGLDPLTDGLFLTVVAFRDLGLFYDAGEALVGIERQNEMSADLYLLKGEILDALGRAEEARAAFDRADTLMR